MWRPRLILRNRDGMTLVEMMIALGLSGVSLLGMLSIMSGAEKTGRNASLHQDFNEFVALVDGTVSNDELCGAALAGAPIPAGGPASIRIGGSGDTISGGYKYGKLEIDSITLTVDRTRVQTLAGRNPPDLLYPVQLQIRVRKPDFARSGVGSEFLTSQPISFWARTDSTNQLKACTRRPQMWKQFTQCAPNQMLVNKGNSTFECEAICDTWDSEYAQCDSDRDPDGGNTTSTCQTGLGSYCTNGYSYSWSTCDVSGGQAFYNAKPPGPGCGPITNPTPTPTPTATPTPTPTPTATQPAAASCTPKSFTCDGANCNNPSTWTQCSATQTAVVGGPNFCTANAGSNCPGVPVRATCVLAGIYIDCTCNWGGACAPTSVKATLNWGCCN